MAVLIDPPTWPAYGTTWSHLVSDVSLEELHRFAASVGLSRRAFDLDHYDVPGRRYDELVAAGAEAVPSRELLVRLQRSGLRVRQVDKRAEAGRRRVAGLRERWAALGERLVVPGAGWGELGEELLARWGQAHRCYHDLRHLDDVLLALDQLGDEGCVVGADAELAAWFHDAVYDAQPTDEEESARYAEASLAAAGVPEPLWRDVGALVRATRPGADVAALTVGLSCGASAVDALLDADLAILAAPPKRYAEYAADVRREYATVPGEAFRASRATILETFLARDRIYRTEAGRDRWEDRARTNLGTEMTRLRRNP